MYQRYYKQRKFGRLFSFVLVIGSGLAHYAKSAFKYTKDTLKLDNLVKYEEYVPNNLKNILSTYKYIRDENVTANSNCKVQFKDLIYGRKEDEVEIFIRNNRWIFRDLNEEKIFYTSKPKLSSYENDDFLKEKEITSEDIKLKETYKLFKSTNNHK